MVMVRSGPASFTLWKGSSSNFTPPLEGSGDGGQFFPPLEGSGEVLTIDYRGDVARLYADGHLIDDNFYDGHPFRYALWRLPAGCRQLELRILPLQKDMPVYFPREADITPGEAVNKIIVETY